MRRLAPLVLAVLALGACGGGSDAGPTAELDGRDGSAVPTTTEARTAPSPLDLGFTDPACAAIGDWLGAIASGGASADYQRRVAESAAELIDPYGRTVAAAVNRGIDHGAAARVDLETIALCDMPVAEGALVAALHGEPDCYLDADRRPVVDGLCELGGPPRTATLPAELDPEFCATVQDFLRRGAGGATGQAAIDELNGFVDASPSSVERLTRDLVDAVGAGDDDTRLRAGLELDRTVVWTCDDAVTDELLRLIGAAIDAVPPPPPPVDTGDGGSDPDDGPGQVDGGSPFVRLCEAIEVRFAGSAPEQWGQVLAIATSVGAPSDVVGILTQLADPAVVGDEARAPLVAALQPFLDGPCQNTGLDEASGPGPDGTAPPPTDPEDDDIPEQL